MRDFLNLITPEDAWKVFSRQIPSESALEELDTRDALGRICAGPILAPHPLPTFSRSAMDGYAVRAKDTYGASESLPAYFQVTGEITMGASAAISVNIGEAVLIHTGGMLPVGSDGVVMLEYTQNTQGNEIEVTRAVAPGENIILEGEEVAQGSVILPKGALIRPVDLGGLMALGIMRIQVMKKPRVAILSTGDEVLPPDQPLTPGKVRDVNTYTIGGLVTQAGGIPVAYGIIPDQWQQLLDTARQALAECDLVVICAGSSASNRDITADVINQLGAPGVLVHGIHIRPGKPTILSVCAGKIVIGLPGNPVSAYIIASLFLKPAIQKLLGVNKQEQAIIPATLSINVPSQAGREDWVPVTVTCNEEGCSATPIFIKSNFIFSLSRADGLIRIPSTATGLPAGAHINVILIE